MADPYVYPGTNVLINKEGIRDKAELDQFERVMTAVRLREGVPEVALTTDGYRAIHRHIFQEVYRWAGEFRIGSPCVSRRESGVIGVTNVEESI
jgi:cell filamentation protein